MGEMFTQLTNTTYSQSIQDTANGVLICFKKLCPHCKNMEKVLEKFSKKVTGVTFFSLDSENDTTAKEALGIERVPTILMIKAGRVVGKKAGLMNPKEMFQFYQNACG